MISKSFFALAIFICFKTLVHCDFVLKPAENVEIGFNYENTHYKIISKTDKGAKVLGVLGVVFDTTPKEMNTDYLALISFPTLNDSRKSADLRVSAVATPGGEVHINVRWSAGPNVVLMDCFDLADDQWFGGPEQKHQYWPVQKLNLSDYSYVTKEYENNAVTEPYWINSNGTILYVNPETPLFIEQNSVIENHLCLKAEVKPPFSVPNRGENFLSYDIILTEDAKKGHMYAVDRYLGKPIAYPDFRMIELPIWSTWARYSRPIDEEILLEFAEEITAHGFNNSQFEIDDLWEICYGSLEVDTFKFPNLTRTVEQIKSKGFRVTLWIHPFINLNCQPWHAEALDRGFLVMSEDGNVTTDWWNNNGTIGSYVDFTNSEAVSWWMERVMKLHTEYGIDSFKFDAGESSWSPQVPLQKGDDNMHPGHITIDYVRAVAEFGPMIEVRSAQRTQDLPVFVRMLDKDTLWDFNNGLPTLVTTLLQMNLNGYPLVLPDMIGGNGYNEKPSKELFIRWLQANTFMPSLQFSFVPWDYDKEAIEISTEFTNLHARYAGEIKNAMEKAVLYGTPVNPPIWWIDPTDQEALAIWDEFLLGDTILVAPILNLDQRSRDIYLPEGYWAYHGEESSGFEGKQWYRNFSAPLDTLPWFELMSSGTKIGTNTLVLIVVGIVKVFYDFKIFSLA